MREAKIQVFDNKDVRQVLSRVGNWYQKMLRMKDGPTMCMKTQARQVKVRR